MAAAEQPLWRRLLGAATWPARDADIFMPMSEVRDATALGTGGLGGSVAAAYACINLVTRFLVMSPRYVVDQDGRKVEHPLNYLLRRPYSRLDRFLGWEIPLRRLLTLGNGFFMVLRSRRLNGMPVDLVPALDGGAAYGTNGAAEYTVTPIGDQIRSGASRTLSGRDVIALHWDGFDGLSAPSPVAYAARNSLQQIRGVQQRQIKALKRAEKSGPALQFSQEDPNAIPTPDQIREYKAALSAGLAMDAGDLPLLPPGIAAASIPALLESDIRAIEILRWAVEDVCRVWCVAPARIGQQSGSGAGVRTQTFIEQMSDLEATAIRPVAERLDAACEVLLSREERMEGMGIHTNTDWIGLGTLANRIEMADRACARGGFWQVDEARELTDKDPLPNGEGEKLYDPKGAPKQGEDGGAQPQEEPA